MENTKAIVDTNVLIYDYVEDSERHKEAEAILDSLDKWIIPAIVIHEFVWFLKGMKLEDRLNDVTGYLQHQKAQIVCDCSDNLIEAMDILRREKLSISDYKDMIILSHAIREKYPIATFDKRFSKIANRYHVTVISRA